MEFFKCSHCGNIIGMVKNTGVPVKCCGQNMEKLEAGVSDAAQEKHVPVATVEGNTVHVKVGSAAHPMLDAHFIEWVAIETAQGAQRKALLPDTDPAVDFAMTEGDTLQTVYAYCNLHGLWKA